MTLTFKIIILSNKVNSMKTIMKSQYSTVVLTVVRVMIAKYRK